MLMTECQPGREPLTAQQMIDLVNSLSKMEVVIRVSTGFRSGTYQRLLVSEFGKICAKSPDVAKEIVTGSLNTVSSDQVIAIESTAEGRSGYFYEYCQTAQAIQQSGRELTPMDMRFFFFPWFDEPGYRLKKLKDNSIIEE